MITISNDYKTNFGMAFYYKSIKNINTNYYDFYIASKRMDYYANLKSTIGQRGFLQFKKEMLKLNNYDVVFNHKNKSVEVVEKATNKIIEIFEESPEGINGLNYPKAKKFPGRKIFAYLFNPKQFLPRNIILAGEKAKQLENIKLKGENLCK